MAKKRFQVYLSPDRVERVKNRLPGFSESEIFIEGLSLLEVILNARDKGHTIAEVTGVAPEIRPLLFPNVNMILTGV